MNNNLNSLKNFFYCFYSSVKFTIKGFFCCLDGLKRIK